MCMRDTGVTGWNSYVRDTVYDPRFRENSHGIDAARYAHLDKSGKDISAETISALFDDRHHD